jgi:hypothetical protein
LLLLWSCEELWSVDALLYADESAELELSCEPPEFSPFWVAYADESAD